MLLVRARSDRARDFYEAEALRGGWTVRRLRRQIGSLFVIDGTKALRAAIRERSGRRVLVQRCQEHEQQNVLSHLPERLHPSVAKTMRDAYRSRSRATAKKRLLQLAAQLPAAAPPLPA